MHTLEQLRSGALAGTRRLDLNGAGLTHLPPEVYGLADTLEVLNLSDNRLDHLPQDLSRLTRLQVIFCSDNPFTHLPEVLGDCPALEMVGFKACRIEHVPAAALPPRLRWLTLTDNAIAQLPTELGLRPELQKLMLAGNRLQALPGSMAQAERLELLRLAANRLTRLPGWVTELPALAWLALAGNPLGWSVAPWRGRPEPPDGPSPLALPRWSWDRLAVGEPLGEGASGWIHRVSVPAPPGSAAQPDMALKLFKGAVTSDGLPEHELAASLAAGQHPSLCTPCGELSDHPEGLRGLLLPLIPSGHVNLAAPPSLASCTRDVYPAHLVLAPAQLHRLARQMAGAVAHLHAQGLMHGDLYAHNMLWNPTTGDVLLTDFGAATCLPVHQPELCRVLLALEVLAFGRWLQELLARADSPPWPGQAALVGLAQACVNPEPLARPTMAEVLRLCPH